MDPPPPQPTSSLLLLARVEAMGTEAVAMVPFESRTCNESASDGIATSVQPYASRPRCLWGGVASRPARVTSQASRTGVRGRDSSEARQSMAVATAIGGSVTPRILMWGMGGAAAESLLATAVRRACAETMQNATPENAES